jgi:hypothetical protein
MNYDCERISRGDASLSSTKCQYGLTPRLGKIAKREKDCVVDCKNEKACKLRREQAAAAGVLLCNP